MDKECQTVTWLDCETEVRWSKMSVMQLRCSICTEFKTSIATRRNFSERWISGADSVRTSNVHDHARQYLILHSQTNKIITSEQSGKALNQNSP